MLLLADGCAESVRESGGKVLAFCQAGISRSAAICIAYLMQRQSMTMDEAHDYVKSRRTFISPNLNFMRQLHEFDGRLRADRARLTLTAAVGAGAGVGPSFPSRPALRSLQSPAYVDRRRWLLPAATPTFAGVGGGDSEAAPGSTRRAARCSLDLITRRCSAELRTPAADALLSVVSPGFRLGSISAPIVSAERSACRRDRLSASTPSYISRRAFVYPLPLNTAAKTSLIPTLHTSSHAQAAISSLGLF